jgi:hypothetical protein
MIGDLDLDCSGSITMVDILQPVRVEDLNDELGDESASLHKATLLFTICVDWDFIC